MFANTSTSNPCSFMEEGSLSYLTATHVNPNSSPSFLNLQPPPSFLDDDQDEEALITHFLSQHQHLNHFNAVSMPPSAASIATPTKAVQQPVASDALLIPKKSTPPRRRVRNSGKKDRHTKICTARGPRDRRMRLSLQIARKFFDLQDMLGFDKASKTIEWLFSKSRPAIKGLARGDNNSTSTILPQAQPRQTAAAAAAAGGGGSSSTSEAPRDQQSKAVSADKREKTTMIRGEHCTATTPGLLLTNPNDDVTADTFAARFEELCGGGGSCGDSEGEEHGGGLAEKFYGNVFGEFPGLGDDYWEIINYGY